MNNNDGSIKPGKSSQLTGKSSNSEKGTHIGYFLGGPYDLTKKVVTGQPFELIRLASERIVYDSDSKPVVDMSIYRYGGQLRGQVGAHIYEYSRV